MFDDTTAAQPTNDAGVTSEPAPGGVLGPAPDATAASAPMPDPVAAPDPTTSSAGPVFNTTPQSTVNEPVISPTAASTDVPANPAMSDDLMALKQQALQSLTPLLSHLEQSPEEKFKTTMMMIQASDDQSLVKTAYEAAQSITDEKEKAQALLDIVNEINYFTQQGKPA